MKELAINGGTPAFQPDELAKLVPAWPPVYPETEQKLLEIYEKFPGIRIGSCTHGGTAFHAGADGKLKEIGRQSRFLDIARRPWYLSSRKGGAY